jgi:hypothetical protein
MLFYMGKDRMPEIAALYVGESTIESCFFVRESTIESCFLLERAQ